MKFTTREVLFSIFCVVVLTVAITPSFAQPIVSVAGVYENFTIGKGSGDLEGMRVVIVPAGGSYYAIVQIAQGGAEDPKPEFVPVEAKGKSVSFSVGDAKFTGAISVSALTLKDSSGQTQVLKRKACSSYMK
jgi:hypothetical protein